MPNRGQSEIYVLDPSERHALMNACEGQYQRTAVKLQMYCGLRISEFVHMDFTWIHADGLIHIPQLKTCSCKECEIGHWRPKTKAGARNVPIPAFVWDDVRGYYTRYPDGIEFSRGAVYYHIKRLLVKAGVKKDGFAARGTSFPHALRATAATWLAENELTASEICYIMGWLDLRIASRYINPAQAAQRAAEKLMSAKP